MPLYETRLNAFNNNDIDTYLNTLHDDFVFVSHQKALKIYGNKIQWP